MNRLLFEYYLLLPVRENAPLLTLRGKPASMSRFSPDFYDSSDKLIYLTLPPLSKMYSFMKQDHCSARW